MKNSVVFLVAATVFATLFLEASTVDAILGKIEIDESDKQFILKAINSTDEILALTKATLTNAESEATGTTKVNIVTVLLWLDIVTVASNKVHNGIKEAIASGLVLSIKKSITEVDVAVTTVRTSLPVNVELLPEEYKEDFKDNIETALGNATAVREVLETALSNNGVDSPLNIL